MLLPAALPEPDTGPDKDPDAGFGLGTEPDGQPGHAGREKVRRRWSFPYRAAILAVCLLLGCLLAAVLLRDRSPVPVSSLNLAVAAPEEDEPEAVPEGPTTAVAPEAAAPASQEPPAELVIHVAGAVGAPGVVKVPAGSRVVDAVSAAGGPAPDADLAAVNLASALQDGAMVVVPRIGELPPPVPAQAPAPPGTGMGAGPGTADGTGTSSPGGAGGSAALVNLNTADAAALETLPRVGPVLASRIIQWRSEQGPFSRPEDLDAVPGIGAAMLAALLPLVTV